jgi:hypothetical protein
LLSQNRADLAGDDSQTVVFGHPDFGKQSRLTRLVVVLLSVQVAFDIQISDQAVSLTVFALRAAALRPVALALRFRPLGQIAIALFRELRSWTKAIAREL